MQSLPLRRQPEQANIVLSYNAGLIVRVGSGDFCKQAGCGRFIILWTFLNVLPSLICYACILYTHMLCLCCPDVQPLPLNRQFKQLCRTVYNAILTGWVWSGDFCKQAGCGRFAILEAFLDTLPLLILLCMYIIYTHATVF